MNLVGVAVLCVLVSAISVFFGFLFGAKFAIIRGEFIRNVAVADEIKKRVMETTFIDCPVCEGSGKSPFCSDNTCQCCFGDKKITNAKHAAIIQVNADLKKKMQERGIRS